jgi:putative ABC transport system permease protein
MKSLFRAAAMAALLLISGCALAPKRSSYSDPGRLVSVVKVSSTGEQPILKRDFLALRSESKTLAPIAGYVLRKGSLHDGSTPERIQFAMVSMDFFPALGVKPALGRALHSEENQSGRDHIAVISYNLWQRRFGGDPNLIGRAITLDHDRYTVVGVMPADFQVPKECELWTPLAFDIECFNLEAKCPEVEVIARLKPGVTLDEAQAEVSVITRRLGGDPPENNAGREIKLTALRESSSQKEK